MLKRLAALVVLVAACGSGTSAVTPTPFVPTQAPPPTSAPTLAPSPTPSQAPTVTPTPAPPELIFQVFSLLAVGNGPTAPSEFTIDSQVRVVQIATYHWNDRQGLTPGTIALESSDGTTYGPWSAYGRDGMGGVPNAYWVVDIDQTLPAGTYRVIDSDPASWSYASDTAGRGITDVYGYR